MKVLIGIVVLSVFHQSLATNVSQCHDIANPIENLSEKVKVGNCKKAPCRLRKNTKVSVDLKLKPESDIEQLTNSVQAYLLGVPFPFPGFDQSDACSFIYDISGKNKVGCPLKAGQEYLYKNEIDVLQIYPRVKLVVHWALTNPSDKKDLICFEIPARITN